MLKSPIGISCLLAVYANDNDVHLYQAFESICNQVRPADEIIVVEDGPLSTALHNVLDSYVQRLPMIRVRLEVNSGLGIALAAGIEHCSFDLIARMDADDIARPERFERQEKKMRDNPDLVLLGSGIEEFVLKPGDLKRFRNAPKIDADIRRRARTRNPFNHMSVIFRKESIKIAGGYRDRPGFEDYDLWLRVLKKPGHVENLDEVLVDVRVGDGMLSRRRGFRYLRSELSFLLNSQKQGLLSMADMLSAAFIRIPARLVPARVLKKVYELFLRNS